MPTIHERGVLWYDKKNEGTKIKELEIIDFVYPAKKTMAVTSAVPDLVTHASKMLQLGGTSLDDSIVGILQAFQGTVYDFAVLAFDTSIEEQEYDNNA
jgi:hypothetical protein